MKTCLKCGLPENEWPTNGSRLAGYCSEKCFSEHFWDKQAQNLNEKSVVVNHTKYQIGEENPHAYFRGHGGRLFRIQFNDGRYRETRDLWCQGDVPKDYWERIPDNAKFIRDKPIELL